LLLAGGAFGRVCGVQVAELAKLKSTDLAAADDLGVAVSVSGNRALVGADFDDDLGNLSGSAYVFERSGSGAWQQVAKLTASDGAASDFFGSAVSIDGDRAAVGSWGDDDLGPQSGSVYVFELQPSGNWAEVYKVKPYDGFDNDKFGGAVSLDGDRLLVGADFADAGGIDSGTAYVFERQADGTWLLAFKLAPSDASVSNFFGVSVALDGDRALVGARGANGLTNYTGAAYVFERFPSGTWVEMSELNAFDGATGDFFGIAVAIDGDVAVVGSHQDDDAGTSSGSAHVFKRHVSGVWAQVAKLVAGDAAAGDTFGKSLALNGERALIGASSANGGAANSGTVYLFEQVSPFSWVQQAKLNAGDAAGADEYGGAVDFDGERAIIGSALEDDAGNNSGAAYVFDLEPLSSDVASLSLAAGGSQAMEVDAGHVHASELYWVLGSATGTSPGIPLGGGLTLPLIQDAYFLFTLGNPSTGVLSATFGTLNANGHAAAAFAIPPASDPSLAGVTGYHAFAAIALPALTASFASNALSVQLVP
jgi:hypothetical protein